MTNITVTDRSLINTYPLQSSEINSTANNHILNGQEPAQSIVALASQPGVMTSILHGQSLVSSPDSRPLLSSPSLGQQKINSEQADMLMKLSSSMKGGDINLLERAAASAATVLTTNANPLQVNGKVAESSKPAASMAVMPAAGGASQHPERTHAAVEGGTDITSTTAPQHHFVNIMGDMKLVMINNQLTVSLTKSESDAAKASAKSTIRVVEAADRAGNKMIQSEKERFNGAVTAVTGESFIAKALQPLMDAVVQPLIQMLGKIFSDILISMGVDKATADMVGQIMGAVVAAIALVAAAMVASNLVGKMTSTLSKKIGTETVKRALNEAVLEQLKKIGLGAGKTLGLHEAKVAQISTYSQMGLTGASLFNTVTQTTGSIIAANMKLDAAKIRAQILNNTALQDLLDSLLSRSLDAFRNHMDASNAVLKNISSVAENQLQAGKYITRHMGAVAG